MRLEVAVLRRQVHRPALEPADRAVLAGFARLVTRHRLGHLFVQPATLRRWHRDLVAKRWTYPHRRPGRPVIPKGAAVVLRSAKENPQWGYRRIRGELATTGVVIAPSSVWAILKRHGIEPSPRRSGPTRSFSPGSTCSCSSTTTVVSCGSPASRRTRSPAGSPNRPGNLSMDLAD